MFTTLKSAVMSVKIILHNMKEDREALGSKWLNVVNDDFANSESRFKEYREAGAFAERLELEAASRIGELDLLQKKGNYLTQVQELMQDVTDMFVNVEGMEEILQQAKMIYDAAEEALEEVINNEAFNGTLKAESSL